MYIHYGLYSTDKILIKTWDIEGKIKTHRFKCKYITDSAGIIILWMFICNIGNMKRECQGRIHRLCNRRFDY